jgi:hypothetical protein
MKIHIRNSFETIEGSKERNFTDALADPHHPSAVVPSSIRSISQRYIVESTGVDRPSTVTPQDIIGAKAIGSTPQRVSALREIAYSD